MEAVLGMRALKDMFGFPFRDEGKGKKFLTGSLVFISGFFIPILPWIALLGYAARIARNSIEGQPAHLPEWENWSDLLADGLKLFVTSLLLSLPSSLLFIIGFGTYIGGFTGALIAQASAGDQASTPFFMLMMFSMAFMFFAMTFGTLLACVSWFLLAPVGAHVVANQRLSAAFEIRQWWRLLAANWGGFALVFFVMFALWAIEYLLFYLVYTTIVLCMFIPIILAPFTIYMVAITSMMAGQSYREAREKLDAPVGDTPVVEVAGV